MFWTSEDLKAKGRSFVDPFEGTRVVNCSYELALGEEGFVTGKSQKKQKLAKIGDQIEIPSGQFALLLTEEVVQLPDHVIGLISMKSSLKIRGLVNVSGFHVDPGWKGKLVFSVYNAGGSNVVLSRGEPSFLLWISDLSGPTTDLYRGTRQGQSSISNQDTMNIGQVKFSPVALNDRLTKAETKFSTARQIAIAAFAALVVAIAIQWLTSVRPPSISVTTSDVSSTTIETSTTQTSTTVTAP